MKAAAEAARITEQSGSNLWFVGRLLSPERRRLFEAAYASMRQIDDFIDDDFLCRPPSDRKNDRNEALSQVDAWETACLAAIGNDAIPDSLPAPYRAAIEALSAIPVSRKPPSRAWVNLAMAMRHDIQETPMESWNDFLAYCEGATVAPAAVFLHVLIASDGESVDPAPSDFLESDALFDLARPMAVFCYLVHIVRDIAKDAAAPDQLLTIPKALLEQHDVRRVGLQTGDTAALPLLNDLLERAAGFRAESDAARASLKGTLGRREALVLDALLGIYRGLHDRLLADPGAALRGEDMPTERIRRAVFKGLGLS